MWQSALGCTILAVKVGFPKAKKTVTCPRLFAINLNLVWFPAIATVVLLFQALFLLIWL